jgi:O-methyltransferase involved in polyketide biosynthesis
VEFTTVINIYRNLIRNENKKREIMMKLSTKTLKDIPETLLWTLYMNYKESKRSNGKIKDSRYGELISKIDYDFSQFENIPGDPSLGIACRALLFDQITREHIDKNSEAIIVSLGSGLDFRFDRLDNGKVQWFDLDLPEVIELRRKIFSETNRLRFIAASVLNSSWLASIPCGRKIFFIAEGLLAYLTEEQVKNIFINLATNFSGSTLLFDAYSSWGLEMNTPRNHPFMNKMYNMCQWTINSWNDVEKWGHGIKVIDEWFPWSLYGERVTDLDGTFSEFDYPEDIMESIKEQVIGMTRIGLVQFAVPLLHR